VPQDGFPDYYEVLQISPNAQVETIHRVYRLLAQHYHPDNKDTGDLELFNQVLEAYRVLSDPEQRAAYDVEYRTYTGAKWKIFENVGSMQGLEGEKRKRIAILSLLYTKRMNEPDKPTLTIFELEQFMSCPREHLELSLWYLRESGRIMRGDNGRFALTYKGLETLEESTESASARLRLPSPTQPEPMDEAATA
jgi:curved DNA-binding protein CbpA